MIEDPDHRLWAVNICSICWRFYKQFILTAYYLFIIWQNEGMFILLQLFWGLCDIRYLRIKLSIGNEHWDHSTRSGRSARRFTHFLWSASLLNLLPLAFYLNWIHSVLVICTQLCDKHFSVNYVSAYSRIAFLQLFSPSLLLLMRISLR